MVDVGVQTSQLQRAIDHSASLTDHSYFQLPAELSVQPTLDTTFITSPHKDQDTSKEPTPSPPPSPDQPDWRILCIK